MSRVISTTLACLLLIATVTGELILSSFEDVQMLMRNELQLGTHVRDYIDAEHRRLQLLKEYCFWQFTNMLTLHFAAHWMRTASLTRQCCTAATRRYRTRSARICSSVVCDNNGTRLNIGWIQLQTQMVVDCTIIQTSISPVRSH